MSRGWEIAANAFNLASILLAGRNSIHTWWAGIIGCALFARVFFEAKLYADATLQLFFIGGSIVGWWHWVHGTRATELPVRHAPPRLLAWFFAAAALVTIGYAVLLLRFTDAAAPFLDSVILAFSVLGQFLLMGRRVETWWCWLLVNTVAVPLYTSRGLHVTAVLYAVFWVNALFALRGWRRLARVE